MVPDSTSRDRILQAMPALVAQKGYAAVTIDDIARAARISKRTFYDHFADKQSCFLAAYESAAEAVLSAVVEAAGPRERPWRERVDAVLETYLRAMAFQPAITRVFHVEIQAAGAEALELRQGVTRRYATLLRRIVREGGEATLDEATAMALLGAAHELVLHAVAHGRTARLPARMATLRPLLDGALQPRQASA